jgi:Tfp pilus assembly protein PilN
MEMINLLPFEEKRQLRAARGNTLLIRYNFFLLGVVAFLGLAIGFTYVYLSNTKTAAKNTTSENAAKVSDYASIEAQAQQFRDNLSTAKTILGNEVVYTKVIIEIAQLLPPGVVLDSLNLDAKTFGTQTTLAAKAKDYPSALALKESFQKSPLFTNVHFLSISSDPTNSAYPFTVSLNIIITKDAAK